MTDLPEAGPDADLARAAESGPLSGRRLRLLWITPFWPTPSVPTAQPQREAARLMARAGHSVVMLGMSEERPEPSLARHPNLAEDAYVEPGLGPRRQLRGLRAILSKALRYHHERPFDLVYVRFAHPVGITAAVVAAALGRPLVYQEEAPDLQLVTRRVIERLAMATMKHRAAICCASGPATAQDLQEIIDRPVYPIPLPVDTDSFRRHPPRSLHDGEPVRLVAVGRLHEQKGTLTLVEAMGRLPDRFRLTFVGAGDARTQAENLVRRSGLAGRITFAGPKPPGEIPGALAEAHVFVLPSTVESFCVAAAEALASGLPTVVTRCGGPEYFVGPQDGRAVEPRDPVALSAAVADVVDGYDAFDQDAIAERAATRFGPAATLVHYEAMYANVLGLRPLPPPGPFGPFWFS